jgi:hypothetical protein
MDEYTFGGNRRKQAIGIILKRVALFMRAYRLFFRKIELKIFYKAKQIEKKAKPVTIKILKVEILKPSVMYITYIYKDKPLRKYYINHTDKEGGFIAELKKAGNKATDIKPTEMHYMLVRHKEHERIEYKFTEK